MPKSFTNVVVPVDVPVVDTVPLLVLVPEPDEVLVPEPEEVEVPAPDDITVPTPASELLKPFPVAAKFCSKAFTCAGVILFSPVTVTGENPPAFVPPSILSEVGEPAGTKATGLVTLPPPILISVPVDDSLTVPVTGPTGPPVNLPPPVPSVVGEPVGT